MTTSTGRPRRSAGIRTADRGEAPTVAEIGAAVGMRSRASVHYQPVELKTKRAIVREPGRSSGIRLA
ncbi:hypothetical protein [Streptomyces collinus]|uniref:LexA family protein n=1 Tax=Streptomyces collinus TaxID=42684 RepID=UPI0036E8BA31